MFETKNKHSLWKINTSTGKTKEEEKTIIKGTIAANS